MWAYPRVRIMAGPYHHRNPETLRPKWGGDDWQRISARGTMATEPRTSRLQTRRRATAGLLLAGSLLLAACSAAGASPSSSAAAPAASPSISLLTPGPSKLAPDAGSTYTGVLSSDAIEGGCAFLQAADGRKLEVLYPEGWTLQKSPLELLAPDGSVHSRAGDTVSVKGAEATDMGSICQIGPIIQATEVLPG